MNTINKLLRLSSIRFYRGLAAAAVAAGGAVAGLAIAGPLGLVFGAFLGFALSFIIEGLVSKFI